MIFSPIEKFDIINFYFFRISNFFDFSLTNMSLFIIIIFLTILFLFLFTYLFSNFLPNFNQITFEILTRFIFDILNKQVGKKGYIYFTFIYLLFFFIFFFNLYGLFPYSFSVTAHIVITFFFSIIVWFSSIFIGFYENGLNFYKLFVPNVPKYLLIFLIIIELLSYIIRVFSLSIRLAANITSGHVLLFTISGFSVKLFKLNLIATLFASLLLLFVFILEFVVSFLQTYVFITLVCIYFNDSLNLNH